VPVSGRFGERPANPPISPFGIPYAEQNIANPGTERNHVMNSNWKAQFVSAIGAFAAMICLTIAATTPLANAATFVPGLVA
jgi:hypothetical protein